MKPTSFYDDRYRQTHFRSGWDWVSTAGCYAQRLDKDWSSAFDLKNNVPFTGKVGYNLYRANSGYDIDSDTLIDTLNGGWNSKQPLYSAESPQVEFKWWNIEGASFIAAGMGAVYALFF